MRLSRLGQRLKSAIDLSPLPTILTDPNLPDNPIVAVNDAFVRLTQYEPDEVIGRNCRLLAGPGTERHLSRQLADGIAAESPTLVQLTNYRKDGRPFLNAVMTAPVYDDEGNLSFFIGSQMEVENSSGEAAAEARSRFGRLSKRQQEVARLMAQGLRNKQIAERLSISEKTVKMHRAQLLARMEAASSAQAVRIVVEAGEVGGQ
ncbi:MAG TPA: LuxR C-terminal-related transcriptional regulator [Allosphingosinicella sp.]|nr:LuxR C-terminal-related transcriptional regulator [Allosphingosinicella sp.]